jgi:hypothetical protein
MNNKTEKERFEEFKTGILRRAKEKRACVDEYRRACEASTFNELMQVIKENFIWVCEKAIIDVDLIDEYLEEFNANNIFCNEDVTEGYLLVTGSSIVETDRNTIVRAYGSSIVYAKGFPIVKAYDSSIVRAYGSVMIYAYNNSKVMACDSATVKAYDSTAIKAFDNARIYATGSSIIFAFASSFVMAFESSVVKAYGSPIVKTFDAATVRTYSARGKATGFTAVKELLEFFKFEYNLCNRIWNFLKSTINKQINKK